MKPFFLILLIIPFSVVSAQTYITEIEKVNAYSLSTANNRDTVVDLIPYTYVTKDAEQVLIPINQYNFKITNRKPVMKWTLFLKINNTSAYTIRADLFFGYHTMINVQNITGTDTASREAGFIVDNKKNRLTPNYNISIKLLPNSVNIFRVKIYNYAQMLDPICSKLYLGNTYQARLLNDINQGKPYFILYFIVIGGLIILGLFMLTQYAIVFDKAYLFYALFVFSAALSLERACEYNYDLKLFSQFFPLYFYQSTIPITIISAIFYTSFLSYFINLRQKKWLFILYKLIAIFLITSLLIFCMLLQINDQEKFLMNLSSLFTLFSMCSCLLLGVLIVFSYPKNPLVYFVILGIVTLVGGAYISVYLNSHINASTFIKYESRMLPYAISLLAEGLFLSLGLGYKQSLLRKEKESVLRKNLDLELSSLRSQMNPHFIFNCINNIDAFIYDNDKYNATLYLNKFARLIRNILDSSKQDTIAFSKDVETLKLYIELEELRNDNKFKTSVCIADELLNGNYKVPPLIIQPFVENAILHGLKNREDNEGLLQIEIKKAGDKIEYIIKDNGIGRKAAAMIPQNKEASYGMQMSNNRIKLFNKEEKPSVQINDLYKDDIATGTEVIVLLNII